MGVYKYWQVIGYFLHVRRWSATFTLHWYRIENVPSTENDMEKNTSGKL